MSDSAATMVLALYYSALGILGLYGIHRLVLVARYLRHRERAPRRPPDPETWPRVTVQLPLYNERYVVERLIEAVCELDYPRDRLEIQVLDDSTDATRELARRQVERFRALGHDIRHLHRRDRTGYKAGALANGLERARGELVAVFDADFVPPPDFLRRTVPHFADPAVGMVQARWDHLNRDASLLTRIQAVLLDGHFIVEHTARHRAGCFFNFNGTAGIWRRQAIEDAGGWSHDTVTEDLDLSYRSQLAGWKFLYLVDLGTPAELPESVQAFKSQQHRWAKGAIQTGRKLLPRILGERLPRRVKLEAFVHLTNNVSYPLLILLSLLLYPAMVVRHGSSPATILFIDAPLFLAATGSIFLFYLVSQLARPGRSLLFPGLIGLGIGLAVNNTRAVVEGLVRRGGVFERTPKSGRSGSRTARRRTGYRARAFFSFPLEGLLTAYMGACSMLAILDGLWLSLPFLALFLWGYAYMFSLTVAELAGPRRHRPASLRRRPAAG